MDWMHSALDRIRETQHEHSSELKDIKRLLQQRQSMPRLPAPKFEWAKWAPRVWWGLLAAGLVTAKMLDLPEVAAILSRLS